MDKQLEYRSSKYEWVSQLPPELVAAVMDDDVVKLQSLREAGASLNVVVQSRNDHGDTLLVQALIHKKAAVFDYLLTLEDIPLDMYYEDEAPIELTFTNATENFALKLIERGCYIDFTNTHGTLLHLAISKRWIVLAEKLIEEGADVNYQDKQGDTPLLLACQNELVDEVFMLLFYGADPCIKNYREEENNSLDMLAQHTDAKVQDFFLNILYPHYKVLNLTTIVYVMRMGSITFPKLLQSTTDVEIGRHCKLLAEIGEFKPEYFKLFIDKFFYVVEQVMMNMHIAYFFEGVPMGKVHEYVENLYIILNHHILCPRFVNCLQEETYPVVERLIEISEENGVHIEILTKLVCCFLSHGISLNHHALHQVFYTYGHCELFKIMLHMDINNEGIRFKEMMPAVIYNINMSLEKIVKHCTAARVWRFRDDNDCRTLLILLDYFALPKLKALLMNFNLEELTERIRQLPAVPSLVELARNSARAFIISKYKTTNSSQFYTVLKWMPIAGVYKQIIAFEKKLYLPTKSFLV